MRALAGLVVALAACPASPPPAREPPKEPFFPTPRAEAPPPEPAPPGPEPDEDPWQAFATGDEAPGMDGLIAQAFLAEHNAARAQHCAPPLAWSPDLAAVADRWAKNLRDRGCAFDHSGNAYGENLFAGTSGQFSAREIVGAWVDERELYDFARGGFSMQTGHFTQVVWKGTTQVGCAVATCKNMDLVVCNYDPPGNVRGGYQKHVLPRGC